jgi:thiol-disulfide isomerase/thioredoxin
VKRVSRGAWVATLLVAAALPFQGGRSGAAAEPNVRAVDGKGLKKALVAHRGKVVVLNLWATWCAPCVDEFPEFVKLHNEYKSKGLTVIAASMDEPRDRGRVVDFIAQQEAAFPVYLRSRGDLEQFFDPIDRKWSGAVPTTYIFDRRGKLVGHPHTGPYTYSQLVGAVSPVLNAK